MHAMNKSANVSHLTQKPSPNPAIPMQHLTAITTAQTRSIQRKSPAYLSSYTLLYVQTQEGRFLAAKRNGLGYLIPAIFSETDGQSHPRPSPSRYYYYYHHHYC